jgi:sulfopyruvate decarboxylase TPP-binding subunit|tara:strand:+ start:631 stop:1692 length:1062 start_codon:yes stop_codon:yes gene_type:complete
MLDTNKFVDSLASAGYSHLCVVPCSFAKHLINSSINSNEKLEYLPCASEAVACSVAAGLKISGMRPIVIVQSSGLTNMGSCITSMLIPYNISFPIIVSWRTYKEGDSEIQHQHLATKLPDLVEAYGYTSILLNKIDIDIAIDQILDCENTRKICLLEKDTFSKENLKKEHLLNISKYPKRSEYLKLLNDKYKNTDILFIGTTGNTAREMYSFMPDTKNFYMAGNMGGALSVGLGSAKAGKKTIVCGGDAEFVMHLGGLTTTGRYLNEIDLTYIMFDNESNKSTGGQNTYQRHVNYRAIAKACGFDSHDVIMDLVSFSHLLEVDKNKGLFSQVKCSYDEETPRPPIEEVRKSKV